MATVVELVIRIFMYTCRVKTFLLVNYGSRWRPKTQINSIQIFAYLCEAQRALNVEKGNTGKRLI